MRALLPALALLCAPPAFGQGEPNALKAFQRAFFTAKTASPDSARRLAALETLSRFDSEKVAKALLKAFTTVNSEVLALDSQRHALDEELRRMLAGQEYKVRKTLPQGQMNRYRQLKGEMAQLRSDIDARRETMGRVAQTISERRDLRALTWLLRTVSGSKKQPLYLKIKVAQAAGGAGAAGLPALLKATRTAKQPEELAALLTGIGMVGEAARSASSVVIGYLTHKAPMVRERAALALSTICDPKAIAPMIELLGSSFGQSKKRIGAYLEALTRQKHGVSAPTWKRWFAAEGARYLSGEVSLGGGAPSSRKKTTQENYYFGIPQDGKSIVYIIDSSGSMSAEVQLHLPHSKPQNQRGTAAQMEKKPGEGDKKKTTRLEACKAELIRALGLLEPTTMFNVIWYADLPYQFRPAMLPARAGSIKSAQEWVRKLQPNGSTNIHDSMQMGFQLTGQIAGPGEARKGPITGKQRTAAPDTIFLLSDGSPTLPNGEMDSTGKIIESVRKWNALKTVTVHCIGIGRGVNGSFMRKLATENGGEFKRF